MKHSSWKPGAPILALLLGSVVLFGCGGDSKTTSVKSSGPVTMPKKFNVPPGADPSVPAEMGGAGFEKFAADSGWQSGPTDPAVLDLLGDKDAKKGGQLVSDIGDFPATFRIFGKDASTATTQTVYSLVYQDLIDINPVTMEFLPRLASHWKVDPTDKQTYYFRINPNARFSDGAPVTTEDVIETFRLGSDPGILDPYINSFFGEFDPPVAVSKYILKVHSKKNNWKNMMYFGGQQVYPANVIKGMSGGDFIKKFQTDMPPGTGPYVMLSQDLNKQKNFTLTRVADWWQKDDPVNAGQFNFDKLRFNFIEDENLRWNKFLAGESDWYYVNRSLFWVKKMDSQEVVQRGLIQKRKVFNDAPQSIQGYGFNMRKWPFDDVRVRQAFMYLFNRSALVEKIMYNEYELADSYFPGSPYANPNNPKYRFDPQKAAQLLAEAGYTTRNADGVLTKEGRPLEFEIDITKDSEPVITPVQQDLKQAGIKMNIRFVDFAQLVKLTDEQSFTVVYQAFTGIPFPNPEPDFHSKYANQKNSRNYTGFANPLADKLIEQEQVTFDQPTRVQLLRQLDSIFMQQLPWAITWYPPFSRFGVWAYVKMPKFGISRIGDYRDAYQYFWYDADAKAQVEKAKSDKSVKLDIPPVNLKFWPEWDAAHPQGTSTGMAGSSNGAKTGKDSGAKGGAAKDTGSKPAIR